ncbi:MAG TPA: VIT family protein [Acidothermaceae bacterium]|nr:VIT family protein [Acidothermaceae bacterium]
MTAQSASDVAARPAERALSSGRAGWLRAAVLGANDGLVSTASLMVGVAASHARPGAVLTAGIAGVAAGAMAMAAGEYVSVSSQVDVERADVDAEARQQERDPIGELAELADIYEKRGLPRALAEQVASAFHARDPLGAHMRDEWGQTQHTRARPVQAAMASASSFLVGGLVPFIGMLGATSAARFVLIFVVTVAGLAVAGAIGARIAGGALLRPTIRVVTWGSIAMVVTAGVGQAAHGLGI